MPFTPQEEEDLKKRILALEEEKAGLLKRMEGHSSKEEVKAELDLIRKDLAEARKELAGLKSPKPPRSVVGVKAEDPDAEDDDWPLNMFEKQGGEGEQ